MANWISLVALSALAVSSLSLASPDAGYSIPQVGTGRRSQFFVLHNDGTYKHGHDTGEGASAMAQSTRLGQEQGNFGYITPEGESVNLQYQAGEIGFVPSGSHIPQAHPDFHAAHAAARARPPFVDPLANANTDASYGFQFTEEGQTRSEHSDASGNVRGSYSYTDEDGNTRVISYRAGQNIGFVVEGNDLPVSPDTPEAAGSTPAATRYSSRGRPSLSTFGGASSSGVIDYSTGSQTHTAGTSFSSSSAQSRVPYEAANTRTLSRPDGTYSVAYETSSHSRQEASNRNNNIDGDFNFVADDGQRRTLSYEAGSATGFVVDGNHLPQGPIVPGAPDGRPTGRIVPVSGTPFFDPLANSNSDASYSFNFGSDQHSRSETSDADGTVRGTYTVVEDDGTRRTYRYRAGKGIGYEVEEVSSSKGPRPASSSSQGTSSSSAASTSHTRSSLTSSASLGSTYGAPRQSVASQYSAPASPILAGSRQSIASQYSAPASPRISGSRLSAASHHSGAALHRSAQSDFQLQQYDASRNPNKFGYVLTFDN